MSQDPIAVPPQFGEPKRRLGVARGAGELGSVLGRTFGEYGFRSFEEIGVIFDCFPVVHLAADLGHSRTEVGRQFIESGRSQLSDSVGYGFQGLLQGLVFLAQGDTRLQSA
ncbi:hypothetical protein [Acidisoma silvae]|uniref:Uncharacterized protein n=1 Tax=Acidisoma silvae TaxID=2802396 RepID=A0A963YVG3_9PROT|nr:hypothetical protein [Acidisoma silvae]MCB8877849.1 hypothetical protein [Acidisoma silvae]